MATQSDSKRLSTAPVFLTAISTILGAIMFLRFGYAVGHVGFVGTLAIVLIGHLVTIPTAMAIAEIATNQKVEGGGEYYIISRSFGLNIGASIGIALYFSQAISVAFYIIAFSQAFEPVFDFILKEYGILVYDYRIVSIPATLLLILIVTTKGADLGLKVLYIVVAILFLSLILFFAGSTDFAGSTESFELGKTVAQPDNFFYVFAICFPAFTGMTAGVGLSGDLKDPKKSIPLGTLGATIAGMFIYFFIVYKLYISASAEDLANDQLIMSEIALWGPIIPIGLAAATISSALGSILVAPRTLQALAGDKIFPADGFNSWLSKGKGSNNEPFNATLITSVIALLFVSIGDVNFVAEIISMFFMVTYGAICMISFLEHFAADPSYRPSFKSKWYLSLMGAVLCIWLMFKMNPTYAIISIFFMVLIFIGLTRTREDKKGMSVIFQGVIFQLSRQMQVFLQKADKDTDRGHWRPSVICISGSTFNSFAAFDLLRWISYKYGFGTYIHRIDGYLSTETHMESKEAMNRLIQISEYSKSNVYLDTLISPSYTSAIAQVIQLPGVSGKENNMILFEYSKHKPEGLQDIVDNFQLVKSTDFDICILASSDRKFGIKKEINIWITSKDYANANLMILMAYIILGHPEWKKGSIKIFVISSEEEIETQREKLLSMINSGRLPISRSNIQFILQEIDKDPRSIINKESKDADLTIIGFREELIRHKETDVFDGYDGVGDVLFMNTSKEKMIV
ncbi:amino acid permease [Nafulsella turpanensis]|uniref:amino acid permease n=1 Tax=Nafulsella turpanensis TaxID=1265690 RepID=UPI000348A494|nr:amino acid permease [Nafulsella turpanensis]